MEHPQQDFDDVFCHVVSPKILLFLARSTSEAVRIAVTQVRIMKGDIAQVIVGLSSSFWCSS